jgi:hypothetical protein
MSERVILFSHEIVRVKFQLIDDYIIELIMQ